jgi:hypothetical protein
VNSDGIGDRQRLLPPISTFFKTNLANFARIIKNYQGTMTEEQYIRAVQISNRIETLNNVKKEIEGTRDHRLWYAEKSTSSSDFRLCSEYRMRDIADILDKHDLMIRQEIDDMIAKLKAEIKEL